jgi:uncharacterized membrane protein YadS
MVGKESSASCGVVVCGRAAVSATQPVAMPEIANGFFSTAPETCRTVAIARIGETTESRLPISVSVSFGTR